MVKLKDMLTAMRVKGTTTVSEVAQRHVRESQYGTLSVFLAQNPLAKDAYSNPEAPGYEALPTLIRDKIRNPRTIPTIDPIYDRQVLEGIASLRETGYATLENGIENQFTTTERSTLVAKNYSMSSKTGTALALLATAATSIYLPKVTQGVSQNPFSIELGITPELIALFGGCSIGTLTYLLVRNTLSSELTSDLEESLSSLHQEAHKANEAIRALRAKRESGRFL